MGLSNETIFVLTLIVASIFLYRQATLLLEQERLRGPVTGGQKTILVDNRSEVFRNHFEYSSRTPTNFFKDSRVDTLFN